MSKKIVKRYLSASDRLSEIMFGLIMAMTIIGASRISLVSGDEGVTGRVIIAAAIGCNIAWGIVDALMYVFTALVDRGKHARLVTAIKQSEDEESAVASICNALEDPILAHLDDAERKQVCATLYKKIVSAEPGNVHVEKDDVAGAIICFLLAFCTAFLVVIPFFSASGSLLLKLWLSRFISWGLLFAIGFAYAHHTGKGKLKTAITMVLIGVLITAVIMVLGG